jgi:ESCRT-II complex subunit VPS22
MHALSMQSAVDTIEKLQVKLSDFAKKHQADINDDPSFRQAFLKMCAPLGVDPLVSTKGFWAKTLGMVSRVFPSCLFVFACLGYYERFLS